MGGILANKIIIIGIVYCVIQIFATSSIVYAKTPNSEDMRQAREFLYQLPPACKNSYISTASDGTVIIYISCEGNDKSMEGSVEIKDGIVKRIR